MGCYEITIWFSDEKKLYKNTEYRNVCMKVLSECKHVVSLLFTGVCAWKDPVLDEACWW